MAKVAAPLWRDARSDEMELECQFRSSCQAEGIVAVILEYASYDALDLADLVRRKEVNPLELTETVIRAIERLNPKINAVITPLFEDTRRTAEAGLPDGPFKGSPFLLKDLLASLKGVPTVGGSRFLSGFVPDHDSELVVRLKRAGLIMLGKTSTPELGSSHPQDPGRTAGRPFSSGAISLSPSLISLNHLRRSHRS